MKKADKPSGVDRRKVINPRYLGVKSRRKRRKEPCRKEDQVDRSKTVGPLGFLTLRTGSETDHG
jgi:hypothetical protein